MLGLLLAAVVLGWIGYAYGGMMKEAVFALVIGVGILPVMATVLVLIIIESDALYHANQAKLPDWVVARFPNAEARVIEDDPHLTHPAP
jgi:Na+/melibiose symporter-like transporter